jgi:putative Mn2+ efflux pump MntP
MFLPVLFGAALGQGVIDFCRNYVVAPIGVIAILVALGASIFRPDMIKQALYVAVICAVMFFIMNQYGAVTSAISQ